MLACFPAVLALLYFSLAETSPYISVDATTAKGVRNAIEIRRALSADSALVLHMSRPLEEVSNTTVALGRHMIHVAVGSKCYHPRFWVRMTGPALVAVNMAQVEKRLWSGSFDLPVEGVYDVDVRWYACGISSIPPPNETWTPLSEPVSLWAIGNATQAEGLRSDGNDQLFVPESAWLTTSSMENFTGRKYPEYMWMNPMLDALKGSFLSTAGESMVSLEGTLRDPHGLKGFYQLTNYEVVW